MIDEREFEARRQHILDEAGAMQARADAYRDQEFAKLFVASGWTQERIAEQVGKSEGWVCQRLRFGRFLHFLTTCEDLTKPPKSLTEGRFRAYFARTDSAEKEQRRFAKVAARLEADLGCYRYSGPKKKVGEALSKTCADGKWRSIEAMAEMIGKSAEDTVAVVDLMCTRSSYQCFADKRRAGKGSIEYRLVKGGGKKIDLETLRVEVSPIIKQLEIEGRKNMATFSPLTVLDLAHKLSKLLERLAK